MEQLFDSERFEQVKEPNLWSDQFEQVVEPQQLWAGKPITVFDKVLDYVKPVTDWFGLFPATSKTTPMITEEGKVINLGKNREPIDEAMNAVSRGLDTASFGTVNLLKKAVTGEGIPEAETTWGSILGGGSSLVGFLAGGPFAAAKWILGGRLHPTAKGLWYVAQAMAEGGATLGIASALSDILPSLMESESLTEMGLRIGESAAISSIVGALFPATGLINSKPLRIAVGMAVMDKIRTMGGEWTSFDDYYNALVHGTEDKGWIAERTFDYLLDFYFLSKVPSMRKALQEMKGNKFVNELDMLNNSEIEQTILSLRENREIRRSGESYPNLFILNFDGKQKTWEDFRSENGLRVALRDAEGNITIGNKGEIHAELWARLPEGKYEDGFVLEEVPGRFFTRKEMMDIYRQLEEVAEQSVEYRQIIPEEKLTPEYLKEIDIEHALASEKKYATYGVLPSVMDLPELVGLAADIMGGKYPTIVEKMREKYGGSVMGLFVPKGEGEIKLKAALFKDIKQVLYVLGHELGHAVDYLPDMTMQHGNLIGRIQNLKKFMKEYSLGVMASDYEIRNELKALTQKLSPFPEGNNPEYTKYRYSGVELYADSITALINNPKLLRDVAPKFYDAFFDNLNSKPEIERLYYEIQDSIKSGTARKESVERLRQSFREGDKKELDLLEKMAEGGETLGTAFIDKNWYPLHRLLKTNWYARVRAVLEGWDYRVAGHEAYIRDIHAKVLKPLDDLRLDYEDFREWLFHQRVIAERTDMANPLGWTPKDSLERINEIKKTMPEAARAFEKAHDEFWKVRKEYFIEVAKRLNIYDEELMKKIENNEDYITFQVQDYLTAKYGATASAKIFQQVGTLKMVTDPFARTLMKDIALMTSMSKIKAVRGIVGSWLELFPNEIRRADTRWNGKFQEIVESNVKGEGLLVDMFEGKAKGWYVPEEIVKSFERNPIESAMITKVLRSTIEPFRRVFTEINYGFFLFNVMRDYYRAARNLPGASLVNFFKYWSEGLKPSFRSAFGIPDDVAQMALKREMLISVTDTRGMRAEDFQVERLLVKYGLEEPKAASKFWGTVNKFVTTLTNVGRALERTPKIAAMKFLDEKSPNLSEAEKSHIVRSWAGSPDFLRKGSAFGIYNNLLIFSNAMKEGYRADVEAMLSSPGTFWYKTAKYQMLPKLVMKAAALGLFGTAIKEVFDKVTEYDKTNYNIIPIGLTKEGKAVYFRLPTDECGRLIGGVFWKMLGLNFNLTEGGLMDYMAGQAPGWNPGLDVLSDVSAYVSGQNPYDEFRGRYAIPDLVWRAHNWKTDLAFAKYIANKLGISLIYRFKTEDDVEIRGWVEKLVNFPILSNILGRFVKVTDYGEKEHLRRDVLGPLDKKRSREILEAHTAIAKLVNGKPLNDADMAAIYREEARGSQVVDRTVMQDVGRKYGSVYTEALMTAQTVEQKIAILQEIARKQRERGE